MDCTIFYSWQSDLPNPTNRGLIGDAINKAIKNIRKDDSIKVEPVLDRDTQNVGGAPDIVKTIFEKIEQAEVFVCDVSIINKDVNSRLTPNPNVLIELGYAMKTLGEGKIIMVINTAFGTPEQLPFDLRMRRVITYDMPVDSKDKATERNNLAKSLERQLRTILKKWEEEIKTEMSIVEKAKVELKKNYPGSSLTVKKYLKWLDNQIEEIAPKFSEKSVEKEDLLIKAIEQTEELVIGFASLAEVIATTKKIYRCCY
ncbi:MAG: nucleotide-binding protein [Okeania sp. SIO2D1]|nr:nucleotide-binding protein [Okeania sp. SIO2D1]